MEPFISRNTGASDFIPYTPLDSKNIIHQAQAFADIIEARRDKLELLLLQYESHEVVQDEIGRTLDLLRNLSENEAYFKLRIGEVTSFLPRNQPLYAFSCFVIVPALMASAVHFRIPHPMKFFFGEVMDLLEIQQMFPNVFVSDKPRLEFLMERSALRIDPTTGLSRPVTDAVIFTGTSHHASKLRNVFDRRTLFISNGSGHNPVIIAHDAQVDDAIEAVTTLQFYNQGQDCAAPNTILVHGSIYQTVLDRLRGAVRDLKIGEYADTLCRIGPISSIDDLARIQTFLCDHHQWIDPMTPGIIETHRALVYPTIITKPLDQGGNYSEIFAPIIFVQKYSNDDDLAHYFETEHYAENAMYVTWYGSSRYIENLPHKKIRGKIIHPSDTLLHNTHLHAEGVERGVCPYGGYGYGASSISINGTITPLPTLPQRDLFMYVAEPIMNTGEVIDLDHYSEIKEKNVQKLLRLPTHSIVSNESFDHYGPWYIDTQSFESNTMRYIEIQKDADIIHYLLAVPNSGAVSGLSILDQEHLKQLIILIKNRESYDQESFMTALYAIPKLTHVTDRQNKESQRNFFTLVYQLLFGKDSGPKLTLFLREANKDSLLKLLEVL